MKTWQLLAAAMVVLIIGGVAYGLGTSSNQPAQAAARTTEAPALPSPTVDPDVLELEEAFENPPPPVEIAEEPPTLEEVAREVAMDIDRLAPGKTKFANLVSSDGYMLECPTDPCMQNANRVPFRHAIAIKSDAKVGLWYDATKQAVEAHFDELEALGFRYVVTDIADVVIGFRLSDWPLLRTSSAPDQPLMGLITNHSVQFSSV